MKRRSFLVGLFAAPVAAQFPIEVVEAVAPVAEPMAMAASVGGNTLLSADVIAREALAILRNNLVFNEAFDG